jgi:N utilization substance protein B
MPKQRQRKRTLARELALQLLYVADENRGLTEEDIAYHLETADTPPEVAAFTCQLVLGTRSQLAQLDEIISSIAVNWRISRMSVVDRNILRMASYELLHIEDIPPKVSINEAVDLAKKYSTADSGSFVNGILDKILSRHGKDNAPGKGNPSPGAKA